MGTSYQHKRFRHPNQIRLISLLGRKDPDSQPLSKDAIHCRIMYRNLSPQEESNEDHEDWYRALQQAMKDGMQVVEPHFESDDKQYEAVSWTWGGEATNESIFVEDEEHPGKWKTLNVRSNLIKVLSQLRGEDLPRTLWVDGVSIDQSNNFEKSHQVAMMADIYGKAKDVCICLGDHDDSSAKALEFISETVSDLGVFRDITTDPQYADHWKALAALMNRPWFGRRWVVQEISHATSATIYCGSHSMKWTDFEMAVALFERDATRIGTMFLGSQEAEYSHNFFGDVEAMGATRLVRAKSKLFLRDDENKVIDYRFTLGDLVTELSTFEAENPRDMIYAVLSLARDTYHRTKAISDEADVATSTSPQETQMLNGNGKRRAETDQSMASDDTTVVGDNHLNQSPRKRPKSNGEDTATAARQTALKFAAVGAFRRNWKASIHKHKVFNVNYRQPFFEICKQFVDFTLESATGTNKLDILCRPWAPMQDTEALPSWIPSVEGAAFEVTPARFAPGGKQMARKNHDCLVSQSATANSSSSPYKACRDQRPVWRFDDHDPEKRFSLFVQGFIIDTIAEAEVFSQLGNVPVEWLHFAGWRPWNMKNIRDRNSRLPEPLWRTLVADRSPDGSSAKVYYSKAFEFAIDNSTPVTGLQTTRLATRSNPILAEFLNRMAAVVWNRLLFKSAQHGGLLGLAPKKAKPNDAICILKGCSVPVVLRPRTTAKGEVYYNFIGECYLHTFMDGRAVDIQESENIANQEFELR